MGQETDGLKIHKALKGKGSEELKAVYEIIAEQEKRTDHLSEGMKKLFDAQQTQIGNIEKNQEEMVKVLAAIRQSLPTGGTVTGIPAAPNQANALQQGISLLGEIRGLAGGGSSGGGLFEKLILNIINESLMFQRTIRMGLAKRLNLTDLFPEEEPKSGT